jgi:hypothetical protein
MNQPDLFDICYKNHGGDECSVDANRTTAKSRDRLRIIGYLKKVTDATCDEVEIALGMNHQTCSARFSELKMQGIITSTTKRPTRTGCLAKAWTIDRKPNAYTP